MRHSNKNRKFSRERDQRAALLNGLARNFFSKGKMQTTEAKAKEIKPIVEKMLTKAKKGDLASRRMLSRFFSPVLTKKIIEEIAPLYKSRQGGYTRITRLGQRKSDSARMAIIELVK
ncbi:MAG: 50S ribosomal protein L17 [Candidatus Pacebacteria bacterium]|nr:50S ribosomal protein L17 [Candidatus Paceibacterota bacterium]